MAHLVIAATGLKVYGEGEWKIRKHGKEKHRVWRKLHLAVDAATHAIVAAEVSLEAVADNEVLPMLLNPLRRKIKQSAPTVPMTPKPVIRYCKRREPKQPYRRERMRRCGKKAISATKRWRTQGR